MGVDTYPGHNDAETRVKLTLAPERVTHRA
jgi:hypothetical protein